MTSDESGPTLSLKEFVALHAAYGFHGSRADVYNRRQRGDGPPCFRSGRTIRYPEAAARAYLERRQARNPHMPDVPLATIRARATVTTPIADAGFLGRVQNALLRHGNRTLGDLVGVPEADLMQIVGIGRRGAAEIRSVVAPLE